MRVAEIRSTFLDYFAEHGHTVVPSSPVVPHDDPTLLFANAGMNQFKAIFTGQEVRDYSRATTTQKCIRAGGKHNDLENVGYTKRHLTFFEMLGNFSFGDYFKEEACTWAWDLVTNQFGLDPVHLWITVYHEDDEAREIWRDKVGVDPDRILGLGEKDNFWSMGDVGPCGPCSEIHFDRGDQHSCGSKCALGVCDCDRWLEFWNLVFMQYEQHPDGSRSPLPKPSIDTGMGLERMTQLMQQKDSVYDTDLLRGIIERIAEVTDRPYDEGPSGTPHRVISDHLRSLSFSIADGAYPSNEDRGYVLRRILRRAARYGYQLGQERPFIASLVPHLVAEMGDAFPELRAQQALIEKLIGNEEEQFGRTLKTGMQRFESEVAGMQKEKQTTFPADAAFFLHDSCGFPIDLTEQMAREQDFSVDRAGFDVRMQEQRERSRASKSFAAAEQGGAGPEAGELGEPTEFLGYGLLVAEAAICHVDQIEGGDWRFILDRTPFYGESGGQVCDTGKIEGDGFEFHVKDVQKQDDVYIHIAQWIAGDPELARAGVNVQSEVDQLRRDDIVRNHTATHLLHSALRAVVGTHVAQKGSLVAPDRLRFDVSHYEKITPEQIREVESLVQEWVRADAPVLIEANVPLEDARAQGAMALFGEKYGDRVRVVSIPGGPTFSAEPLNSIELCGGTHCERTGEIGAFQVIGEGSVSSGVRRVEALSGRGSDRRIRDDSELLQELAGRLKVRREEIGDRVEAMLTELKSLRDGKGKAGQRDLLKELDDGHGERRSVGDLEFVAAIWGDAPQEELLRVGDALKRRSERTVFVLASQGEDGVRFIVGVSDAVGKGVVHCGKIAGVGAKILGGGGGGRPELAQAGGKDASKFPEAVSAMGNTLAEQLGVDC